MLIRGAVYKVDLGEAKRGHEQRGRRLGVLVSPSDWLGSTVTIIPTSTSAGGSVFRPLVEIDGREARLLVDQIRTIDTDYLKGQVDNLSRDAMADLDDALGRYLGIH
ncbi:type II toxin-antitoxin system PemK/MazF family toxin [Nocardia panacis]|uniref:Type II toxin-antitoxin system PemK/MazF family toxin n=1 Tax=Nocardia panacis TaxID=2340916 RepID=A0A3A4KWT5_9NOCA|nr:type II toxin-antitoxin system PemK/MazF family toxin [Nocardia panacis]RJO78034.1 type II toxin-antitoxin system PemK/MazF family toxin [Nocardia panacis]